MPAGGLARVGAKRHSGARGGTPAMNDYPVRHTEEFWDSLPGRGGTIVCECGGCGRTHFADTERADFDEGELESLQKKAQENPGRVIGYCDVDMVSTADLDGITIVWECPCNRAGRYERFLWENRGWILEYLKKRISREVSETAANTAQLQAIADAL